MSTSPSAAAPAGRLGLPIEGLSVQDLDPTRAERLRAAVYRNKLVVLRGLELGDAEYVELARRIGEARGGSCTETCRCSFGACTAAFPG